MSRQDAAKSKLRSEIRSCLASLPAETVDSNSLLTCKHIASSQELLGKPQSIGLYAAIEHEVSLKALHDLLPAKKFAYPLCQPGRQLTFHLVSDINELTPNSHNILEPTPDIHAEIEVAQLDLILCPGLAFGRDGSRLGRGLAYYDRTLKTFSGPKVGVAFCIQTQDSVPHDAHDIAMDYLASEAGLSATTPLRG